jgi:glycosyltransferase involved in cell wall biosynthesis
MRHRGTVCTGGKYQMDRPDILLISTDEFSGVRPALMAALQRAGCNVVYVRQRLAELGWLKYWFSLRMLASALFHYGTRARVMIERTPAAFAARSRVCKAIVDRHPRANIVILIAANFDNYRGRRPPGKRFFVYTDYMNLLSKALPDYGFPLDERNTVPTWNRLERRVLAAQDHTFVMGAHVKPAIVANYGISEERITVVGAGPGLDLDIERDGFRKDYGARRILFVGKLPQKKGLGVLLQAFATVRDVIPAAELHVVTGTPVSGPGVVFHGSAGAEQLKELFYSASVFTMPAFKEPLGLVYLEAMLSKCACIGTSTGSMPEIIEDGVTGHLVTPGDAAALADRLISVLRDPQRLRHMGELGYQRARDYWNWDQVVERMQQVWIRTAKPSLVESPRPVIGALTPAGVARLEHRA